LFAIRYPPKSYCAVSVSRQGQTSLRYCNRKYIVLVLSKLSNSCSVCPTHYDIAPNSGDKLFPGGRIKNKSAKLGKELISEKLSAHNRKCLLGSQHEYGCSTDNEQRDHDFRIFEGQDEDSEQQKDQCLEHEFGQRVCCVISHLTPLYANGS
jgi:hypothetical protein